MSTIAPELLDTNDLKTIKQAFRERDSEKLEKVISIINQSGAISEVEKISHDYSNNCLSLLDEFPENLYRESLQEIVISLRDRSN